MEEILIQCTDGITRTEKNYNEWIANLADLLLQEPEDLTESECKALRKAGYEI